MSGVLGTGSLDDLVRDMTEVQIFSVRNVMKLCGDQALITTVNECIFPYRCFQYITGMIVELLCCDFAT